MQPIFNISHFTQIIRWKAQMVGYDILDPILILISREVGKEFLLFVVILKST